MIVGLAMVKLETAIQESRPAAINDFFSGQARLPRISVYQHVTGRSPYACSKRYSVASKAR
jgi:hypothetical protein